MSYPEYCLRGIPHESQIVEAGLVSSDLFFFSDDHVRASGDFEQSINWQDDDDAIAFTLSQKKRDGISIQFTGGIAIVPRFNLDRLSKLPAFGNDFSYERQTLEENRYHGNLLLKPGVSKQKRKFIATTLAMHVTEIIPQTSN